MPIAIIRLVYFLGPILSLSLVMLPNRSKVAWWLWLFAAIIVCVHWYSFLSATADNAEKISTLWVSVWTPLLLTTAVAGITGDKWRGWHDNPNVARSVMALACAVPSILALIFLR